MVYTTAIKPKMDKKMRPASLQVRDRVGSTRNKPLKGWGLISGCMIHMRGGISNKALGSGNQFSVGAYRILHPC